MENIDITDLLNLPGYSEVRQMIAEWEKVANNISDHLEDGKIIIPNYFFISPTGSGVSHLIDIIAQKLSSLGLIPFSNQRKAIEFLLEYHEDKDIFPAFSRLYNMLENGLSQYGEPFAGVLAIDITDWVENLACYEKRFIRFLHYLVKRDDIQMIIFISNCQKTNHLKDCESVISSILRIKKVQIKKNSAISLFNKLEEYCNNLGLKIEISAKEQLIETIEALLKEKNFNGLKTIKNLAKDIAFEKYRQDNYNNSLITLSDIEYFKLGNEWLNQFKSGFYRKSDVWEEKE